ncbi:glycosyl hydrolase [Paenibacillus sp. LPE1-1-1.1]|uniref:glycosyl hydrolase n=1 Tax=Paenibacillus sp. LPE1-1-1.1 TaxID=3135230 RepID=UPI00344836C2
MKKLGVIFLLVVFCMSLIPVSLSANTEPVVKYEAESGVLSGVTVAASAAGYSGTGYVTSFDASTDSLEITVNAPEQAVYNLSVGYNAPNGDKFTQLFLNGSPAGEVSLKASSGFTLTSAGKLLLNAGTNTITFTSGWGWYDIDYIQLEKSVVSTDHNITANLVNPNASAETKTLMRYLADQYGHAVLSGQQTLSDVSWIQSVTGKKPSVVGFDLMDYSPSRVERGATSTEIENALNWHSQGGIVTFAWHWNAPTGLIDEPGKEWYRGFYSDATTFDVAYALANPNSGEYKLLIRDMDAIAVQLKRLEDARIPVLFRPIHEAEGGWFWWGAKGPEPAKELYRLLYDRLTNYHKIDNLIWIWNSIDPAWYPGSDVVDIVSADHYPVAGDYSPVITKYEALVSLVQDTKIVALTENGAIPDPDLLVSYGAHWSWFCTWTGDFLNDGSHNSTQHLIDVYNHPYVVTLDELPNLKAYAFNVSASAGDGKVDVTWTLAPGAASYDLKRSTMPGGPYTTVASLSGDAYADTGVTNGVTYYYVVQAKAGGTVVATTSEVIAKPHSIVRTVHVDDIVLTIQSVKGKSWARAVVAVKDSLGTPVSGVTVTGTWSGALSEAESGVTGVDGKVTFDTNQFNNSQNGTFTFTVKGLTHASMPYEPTSDRLKSKSITR